MKSFRIFKWAFLHIFLISILACATEHPVLQTPPSVSPLKDTSASVLESLSYSEQGGYTRIQLKGSEPFAPPVYQLVSDPPRLVIDLPNVDLRIIKEPIKIENGTIGEVWATQYDDKGRIEIQLTQIANYNVQREERILYIDIEQGKKVAEVKEEQPEKTATPEKETEVAPVEVKKEFPHSVASAETAFTSEPVSKEKKAREITDITLEKKENAVLVRILADGKLGNYNSFKLDSPSRLVLDIWEVNIKAPRKTIKLPNPYIKEIRVGQYSDKLRLVFDSSKSQLPPYRIDRLDDQLLVALGNLPQTSGPQITLPDKAGQEGRSAEGKEGLGEPSKPPRTPVAPVATSSSPAKISKANTLTGIDFKQMEDRSRIVVTFTEEPQVESSLISKKILAFDFKNVTVPKQLQRALDTSEFRSAVQAIQLQNIKKGKSNDVRVLVKLKEEVPYETTQEGKNLFIDVEAPKLHEAKAGVTAPAPKEGSLPQELKKEEVKKEEVKKEVVKQEGEKGSSEPQKPTSEPTGISEKTGPQPPLEKKAEEQKITEEGASAASQVKVYSGRKISLDFKDADIKNILRLIAEVSNLNIIAGDDVTGKVSMRLVDIPWDQALEVILGARNLGMVRMGNVIRVAPLETLKREEQSTLEAKRSKEKVEDLTTELIPMNYATAKELITQVKSISGDRGDVKVDDRTNTLIVKDIPRNIEKIKAVLKQLDAKTPQVVIEARIVEAGLLFQRELGVSWGMIIQAGKVTSSQGTLKGGIQPGNKVVDLPAVPATGAAGVIDFLFTSVHALRELDIAISAHEANGDVKIISSPKIATLHNKEASIEQGLRIPYLKLTTEGTVTTDFIEANLKLTVTPQITNDGHVKMYIKVRKDAPDRSIEVQGVPSIDKKEAITEVLVQDSGTVVIGGIYTIEKTNTGEGVPLFSRIPLVGWLFKRENKSDQRKDLLIFISPRIIKDPI